MPPFELTLAGAHERSRARHYVETLPVGTRVKFYEPERTDAQAALRRVLLDQMAALATWNGEKITAAEWEALCVGSLILGRVLPGLDDPRTRVVLVDEGTRRRRRSIDQESNLIELLYAVAAQQGVTLPEAKKEN